MKPLSKTEMAELMPGYEYHQKRAKPTHKEADLHLAFCKWVKKTYPDLKFVRHEKEASRSKFNQNLIKVYNTDSGLPDFELLYVIYMFFGLYIEFKRPGEQWQSNGVIKNRYKHQYEMHQHLWKIGRCAYFCNDLQDAQVLLIAYISGNPRPKQTYDLPKDDNSDSADNFFKERGL